MKLKYKQFAFIILVILVFLLSIVAASATPLRGKQISECSCVTISNPLEIENTGNSVDAYHIYQSGRAAEWSEVLPEVVILEPGETVVVDNLINMQCGSKGTSKLYTLIKSSDLEEHFTQKINVLDCSNLQDSEPRLKFPSFLSLVKFSFIVLLIIFFFFLFIFLLLYAKEKLFYRSVNIRRPKQKRKRKKEKRVKRKKVLSPSSKSLILKIFSLLVLIILAFIVFKGIQQVVSEQNQTSEIVEEVVLEEELVEPEIEEEEEQDEEKFCTLTCLKDNKIYLLYSAAGFAILLLLLFVFTRLKDKPKNSKKKKKKAKSGKSKKSNFKKTIAKFWNWCVSRWKLILIVILVTALVILIYVFRTNIVSYLASLKDYVLIYLTYILLGFLLLGIMIFVFSKLSR